MDHFEHTFPEPEKDLTPQELTDAKAKITKQQWKLFDTKNPRIRQWCLDQKPMLFEAGGFLVTANKQQHWDFFTELYTGWADCHTVDELADFLDFFKGKYANP